MPRTRALGGLRCVVRFVQPADTRPTPRPRWSGVSRACSTAGRVAAAYPTCLQHRADLASLDTQDLHTGLGGSPLGVPISPASLVAEEVCRTASGETGRSLATSRVTPTCRGTICAFSPHQAGLGFRHRPAWRIVRAVQTRQTGLSTVSPRPAKHDLPPSEAHMTASTTVASGSRWRTASAPTCVSSHIPLTRVSSRALLQRSSQDEDPPESGVDTPAHRRTGSRVGSRVDIGYRRRLLKGSRCPRARGWLVPTHQMIERGWRIPWICVTLAPAAPSRGSTLWE